MKKLRIQLDTASQTFIAVDPNRNVSGQGKTIQEAIMHLKH